MRRKLKIILFVFIICLSIHLSTYSKYVIDKTFEIAQINVDRTKPILYVTEIKNSNVEYEKYANKNQIITLKVEVNENNIKTDIIEKEKIQVLVGNVEMTSTNININKTNASENITTYQITIKGIIGNGNLQIKFKKGAIVDIAGWKSEEYIANTDIMIDNIAPQATFSELMLPYEESEGTLTINEPIRSITDWKVDETGKIFKLIFRKNGTYIYTIVDYAGNVTQITVEVKMADSFSIQI